MPGSLRVRLFLGAAIIVAVALVSVALFSRHVARMEFKRFEIAEREVQVRDVADLVASRIGAESDPARLNVVLDALSGPIRRGLIMIGPEGDIIAASSLELRTGRVVHRQGDRIELEFFAKRGATVARTRAIMQGPVQAPIRDANGAVLGTLVMLPLDDRRGEIPFGATFDMRLWVAALVAGSVALAIAWAMGRRILGPVEALTSAARRLGAGDLGSRVPAGARDEIGELSRAFNAMAEALARNENLRRIWVTDVAHELRSPLTNLRGQIEAVEDGLLAPSPETLRSLREEVLLLSRLVDDLQTVSIADAGKLTLERAPMSIRDVVEGAIESFRPVAAARGVSLSHAVPELPPVDADATRVGQVLRNLMVNAATHTPAGGSIEVVAEAGVDAATVSVRDTGSGIAREHLPHVFERFYRADPSRARATGGSGLGLAIVKGVIEAHGGNVSVESESGRGSTFRFTLPWATPARIHEETP